MEELLRRGAKNKKIRFGAVGIVNTAVDFIVLLMLTLVFGVATSLANIISSSCALITSYVLNKKAVFHGEGGARQALLFLVFTLLGIWLVQTTTVVLVEQALLSFTGTDGKSAWVLLVAKIAGSVVTLGWNYLWYSRVVFRQPKSKE